MARGAELRDPLVLKLLRILLVAYDLPLLGIVERGEPLVKAGRKLSQA